MTTGYWILLAVIAVLMIAGFVGARMEKLHREEKEEQERLAAEKAAIDAITMPSGELVPNDDELLGMTRSQLESYDRDNLNWLINYVGHKIPVGTRDENEPWSRLFVRASYVKDDKGWFEEE